MAKFCFYHGDDENIVARMRRAARFCWGEIAETGRDSFHLFIAAEDCEQSLYRSETMLGAISGYAVCGKKQNEIDEFETSDEQKFFVEISERKWALNDDWSGSFAAAAYNSESGEIVLCNDVLGHFPLYYSQIGAAFVGGTSLIILSRSLYLKTDAVGVLQRITVPFCNYGRRTMLENVSRLMSGECLKWKPESGEILREYDNSLCGNTIDADAKTAARLVWDCLQNEITLAVGGEKRVAVAMSGGWDSRIVLGGVQKRGASVRCLTYGGENHYETRVARRCAEAVGATHEFFPLEEKYFPSRREIAPLIRETESANYFEWFGMIEKFRMNGAKIPLLLGDLCESIDGRYMTAFSARKARVNSFLRGLLGAKENFAAASDAAFAEWRDEKRIEITAALLKNLPNLSDDLRGSLSETEFAEKIAADLELSFARVRDNEPQFAAAYDELFIWFHRIRFLLANQITWLGAAFRPVSPGLSMRFLRLITTIHPRLKIRKRLMNAIIRLPEFERLARISSAQIPFVSSRAPSFVKDFVWAARFGLDQILIKRTLKNKNANRRQRVLRSLDYVKEYRRASSAANVEKWFSGKNVKAENYLKIFRDRAALDAWTLINVDLAAPANVGIILDLCHAEKETATEKQTAESARAVV
jgi:hypothetical protein